MNWVDLVIVALVLWAGLRGWWAGALRQIARFVGLAAGFVVGVIVAPPVSTFFTRAAWRPLLALVVVLVATMVGSHLGGLVGAVASKSLRVLRLGVVDSVSGVVVGVAGTLVGCFLVAGLLASTTWGSLAPEIQNSTILRAINTVMPPVPSIEAKVQSLFRSSDFPSIFASIVAPVVAQSVAPKRLGPLVTSVNAPSDVVKVLAAGGCSQTREGTAFFVTPRDAVTNAHVVAGEKIVRVDDSAASVVLFDPEYDLAIVRVAALNEHPLQFLSHRVRPGTPVEVVGFPLDATRTAAPGYFDGDITARGRDIYDQGLLTRTFEDIEVNVQPGNSGSPVLIDSMVVGVVESKSLSVPSTAYAIPDDVVLRDLDRARSRPVSTGKCLT